MIDMTLQKIECLSAIYAVLALIPAATGIEPPDQGLCVGAASGTSNTVVLEAINSALRAFSSTGTALTGTEALNQFWGLAPQIIRSNPLVFGNDTSDPKCYLDSATGTWFLTELEIDRNSASGAFGPRGHELLAVTSD